MLLFQLAGCAQLESPFFQETLGSTDITPPAAWVRTDPAVTTVATTPESLAAWWHQFDDPILDQLIAEAMATAPDIRTAQAKLRQARANRDLATANLYPSVGASASSKRYQTGIGAGGNGVAQTLYSAGFDASWEPPVFNGLLDAAAGAEASAAASSASLEAVRASLVAEVARNYISLRANQRRLAIARDNVASQSETLQITEWRSLAGLVTMLDVEQARTSLEQTRASIPTFASGQADAENHLAVLLGQTPGILHQRLSVIKPMPVAPDSVAVGIPADTLRQRPDVRAAELALQAEIAKTAQQDAARYPSLNFSGNWGWQAFSAASLGGSAYLVGALAGSLTANLFDGGRIHAQISAQTAVQDQAAVAYQQSILSALEDVENALTAYANGRERVDARRRAATSARNAATLARTLYDSGATDFQNVLQTERTRLTAEDNLASADAEVLTAIVQLYKALGGGWQNNGKTSSEKS